VRGSHHVADRSPGFGGDQRPGRDASGVVAEDDAAVRAALGRPHEIEGGCAEHPDPLGCGWRAHGRGSPEALAAKRRTGRAGFVYLHIAVDDHSRLAFAYPCRDEKGATAAEFWRRAAAFFGSHGITDLRSCLTDNGPCYRSRAWAESLANTGTRHKRTKPYTPRTNGKAERLNKTLDQEWSYARDYGSDSERTAELWGFLNYYNHERPHSALGHKPPVTRVPLQGHQLSAEALSEIITPIPPAQLSFEDHPGWRIA
jgi:hypothetical protein